MRVLRLKGIRVSRKRSQKPPNQTGPGSEYWEQCQVAAFLRQNYPDVCFCATCGGIRTGWKQAKKMKAMGYEAGTPDLIIFASSKAEGVSWYWAGLLIEMKAPGKTASPEQKAKHEMLKQAGYMVVVCDSAQEAREEIIRYLYRTDGRIK